MQLPKSMRDSVESVMHVRIQHVEFPLEICPALLQIPTTARAGERAIKLEENPLQMVVSSRLRLVIDLGDLKSPRS